MRIIREEAAAVVIDYQEKLVPAMHKKEELIRNSQILLKGLKILGVPMCVTQQYTKGLGMTVSEIQEAAGTKAYMDKISFSTADVIAEQVQGKKYVILCGMEAHICVLQTLIDLKAKGYVPVLVEDCIPSRKKNDKKMAIERAIQEGAIVTTYEAVLFELLKEAGTEESKAIQRLIK